MANSREVGTQSESSPFSGPLVLPAKTALKTVVSEQCQYVLAPHFKPGARFGFPNKAGIGSNPPGQQWIISV